MADSARHGMHRVATLFARAIAAIAWVGLFIATVMAVAAIAHVAVRTTFSEFGGSLFFDLAHASGWAPLPLWLLVAVVVGAPLVMGLVQRWVARRLRRALLRGLAILIWLILVAAIYLNTFGIIQTVLGTLMSGRFPVNLDQAHVLWLPVPNLWWLVASLIATSVLSLFFGRAVRLERMRSLFPLRLALFGVILALVGVSLWGLLRSGTGLGSLINGNLVPEIIPVEVGPFLVSDVRVFWVALVIALYLVVIYFALVYQVHVRHAGASAGEQPRAAADVADVILRSRGTRLPKWQRTLFGQMLFEPRLYVERISERPEAFHRSVEVTTTYDLNLAAVPTRAERVVVPLYIASRGRLEDRLQIDINGVPLIPFSHVDGSAYVVKVVRKLLQAAGRSTASAYRRSGLEEDVARHLADDVDVTRLSRSAQLDRTAAASELGVRLLSLPFPSSKEHLVYRAVHLLTQLRDAAPIVVSMSTQSLIDTDRGRLVQVRVIRRLIPPQSDYLVREVLRYLFLPRLPQSDLPFRQRLAAYATATWRSPLSFRARWKAFWYRFEEVPTLLARRALRVVSHIAGVGSNLIRHPLENASRANSYHLELKGPERTYLARQQILTPRGFDPVDSLSTRSSGQRHAHLHIRNGSPSLGLARFEATFFERTPGSTATAFVAAVSSLVVATVLAVRQLQALRTLEAAAGGDMKLLTALLETEMPDASGLLQILLAFPVVAAVAGVLGPGWNGWHGVLVARVSNLLTVALTVMTLWVSSLPATFEPDAIPRVWLVILLGLIAISVGCLASWIMRTLVHSRFIDENQVRHDTDAP